MTGYPGGKGGGGVEEASTGSLERSGGGFDRHSSRRCWEGEGLTRDTN